MIGPESRYYQSSRKPGEQRISPEPAPERIVENGLIRLGMFTAPVRDMNLAESALLRGTGKSWPSPPLLVEWIGAGIAHPDWYLGMIVVDAKAASLAVVYGYNRKTGFYFSHDRPGFRGQACVPASTWDSLTRFDGRGYRLEIVHRLELGHHEVSIDIAASGKKPAVQGKLVWHEEPGRIQPLVLMSPIRGGGFIYNHKAQMPVEGSLRIGSDRLEFRPDRDIANMDDLKLHPSLQGLNYRWFNFGGFDRKGRLVGADLAHTPQKPDSYWAENCLWVDNRLSVCDPVHFEADRGDPMKPWRATDEAGNIDVTFFPEGGKTVSLRPFGIYHQKCGRFRGRIMDAAGETHEISNYYGCAEYASIPA